MLVVLKGLFFSVVIARPGEHLPLRHAFQAARYVEFALRLKTEPQNSRGLEEDELDPFSTYLLIVDQFGNILTGCRLIDGRKMTIQPELVLPGRNLEISRVLINSRLVSSRDESSRKVLMFSLYTGILEYALGLLERDRLYCDTRLPFCRVLKRLFGDLLEELAPAARHVKNGTELVPVPTCISQASGRGMLEILEWEIDRIAPLLEAA